MLARGIPPRRMNRHQLAWGHRGRPNSTLGAELAKHGAAGRPRGYDASRRPCGGGFTAQLAERTGAVRRWGALNLTIGVRWSAAWRTTTGLSPTNAGSG